MSDYKKIFSDYYNFNHWGSVESKSGPGSSIEQTKNLIREIPFLLKKYSIKTVLDIPCGDFNWMKNVAFDGVDYVGADIVDELVEKNRSEHPGVKFSKLDILVDDLPSVDLILCRDCLFHFPIEMVKKALGNIYRSGSKYALVTNHMWRAFENTDIQFGQYHRLNLLLAPFFLPQPIEIIVEGNTEAAGGQADRSLVLWPINYFERFAS